MRYHVTHHRLCYIFIITATTIHILCFMSDFLWKVTGDIVRRENVCCSVEDTECRMRVIKALIRQSNVVVSPSLPISDTNRLD